MYLNPEIKKGIFKENSPKQNAKDTGSPESQIALFSHRINTLTEHLKKAPKDKATQTGLLRLVGKRKKLLAYLSNTDIERFRALKKKLGIR
jgi:small subunit ribosomal protein S15